MRLTVYSKPHCVFCTKAKTYLVLGSIPFNTIDIMENDDAREMLIAEGHSTMPQIYIDNVLFVPGGYHGLISLTYDDINSKINEYTNNQILINQLGTL